MLNYAYLSRYTSLALAVSGGRDSMAMLHCFIAHSRQLPKFYVINFEHGIRGEESQADSDFVKKYCEAAGVRCETVSLDCVAFSKERGYTIEQGARIMRRSYYEDTVRRNKADRVLTAHHKGDNAESIMMHIARGSGLKGICGIPMDDGTVLRPMLDISREEIDKYCAINDVPYREDSSNSDESYDRNYMRNVIMPRLKQRYESLEDNLAALASRAREAEDFIRSRCVKADIIDSVARLKICALEGDKILAQYSVIDALERLDSRVDITARHIDDIISLKDKGNGARIDLPRGCCACKVYGEVHILKAPHVSYEEIPFRIGEHRWGDKILRVSDTSLRGALRIDADKLPAGAMWRIRRVGDTFLPYGGGRRSLGDWFTDKKVPSYLRDTLPVLACGSEVLAVARYEISRTLAVEDGSKRVLYISIGDVDE